MNIPWNKVENFIKNQYGCPAALCPSCYMLMWSMTNDFLNLQEKEFWNWPQWPDIDTINLTWPKMTQKSIRHGMRILPSTLKGTVYHCLLWTYSYQTIPNYAINLQCLLKSADCVDTAKHCSNYGQKWTKNRN